MRNAHRSPCLIGRAITNNLPRPLTVRERLEARAEEMGLPVDDASAWGSQWEAVLLGRIEGAIAAREAQRKLEARRARYQVSR